MARELEVVTMALPFSAWSLANPISTSDSAAVDDIGLVGVWVTGVLLSLVLGRIVLILKNEGVFVFSLFIELNIFHSQLSFTVYMCVRMD